MAPPLLPDPTNRHKNTLRAFFEPFGKLIDMNVMIDRDTGRNKGYAFVTFEDLDDRGVEKLVSGGGTGWEVDGKVVSAVLLEG